VLNIFPRLDEAVAEGKSNTFSNGKLDVLNLELCLFRSNDKVRWHAAESAA
jgi:hypothetical protein